MSESSLKRSSSEKVSQIFDNFMNTIAPNSHTHNKIPSIPSFHTGKENSFARSNYHKSFHE